MCTKFHRKALVLCQYRSDAPQDVAVSPMSALVQFSMELMHTIALRVLWVLLHSCSFFAQVARHHFYDIIGRFF